MMINDKWYFLNILSDDNITRCCEIKYDSETKCYVIRYENIGIYSQAITEQGAIEAIKSAIELYYNAILKYL